MSSWTEVNVLVSTYFALMQQGLHVTQRLK